MEMHAFNESILPRTTLATIDVTIANWLHEHGSHGLTGVMRVFTILGSPPFVIFLTMLAILLFARRREWHVVFLLGLSVGGGMLVTTGLKSIIERTRPTFEPALAHAYGYSFPSGHVAAATLFYGCIVLLVIRKTTNGRVRFAVVLTSVLLIELIALSRMYLGVHYLTDVLAAQLLGIIWLAASMIAVEWCRRRRDIASQPISRSGGTP